MKITVEIDEKTGKLAISASGFKNVIEMLTLLQMAREDLIAARDKPKIELVGIPGMGRKN
jgi:hypothetical protein